MKREILAAEILEPQSADKAARVRNVVFYSGAKVDRYDWWADERYWIQFSMNSKDVSLNRLNGGAPVLNAHSRFSLEDQIGVVTQAWIEDGQARATLKFSERDEVTPIWKDIQAGVIRNLSMGVKIDQLREITPKGQKEKEYLALGWEPEEISVVPVPADAGAQFLSALPGFPTPHLDFKGLPDEVMKRITEYIRDQQERLNSAKQMEKQEAEPTPDPTRPSIADLQAQNMLARAIAKNASMAAR